MTRPEARWANGVCKTCGQYTHSCKCEHPGSELFKSLFAAPQGGEHSMAGPAHDGEPAVAASWIDSIPTAADGVTCRIADVRRAFREFTGARTEELRIPEVESLIGELNKRGGTCYLEHANLVRAFFKAQAEWAEQAKLTIRGIDLQAERLTTREQTTFRDGEDQTPKDEDFEDVIVGYKLNTGCWHRLLGLLATKPVSPQLRRCPYCTSDNQAIRDTYYDQTCEGCVKRMGQ